jgi:hypothetical protein
MLRHESAFQSQRPACTETRSKHPRRPYTQHLDTPSKLETPCQDLATTSLTHLNASLTHLQASPAMSHSDTKPPPPFSNRSPPAAPSTNLHILAVTALPSPDTHIHSPLELRTRQCSRVTSPPSSTRRAQQSPIGLPPPPPAPASGSLSGVGSSSSPAPLLRRPCPPLTGWSRSSGATACTLKKNRAGAGSEQTRPPLLARTRCCRRLLTRALYLSSPPPLNSRSSSLPCKPFAPALRLLLCCCLLLLSSSPPSSPSPPPTLFLCPTLSACPGSKRSRHQTTDLGAGMPVRLLEGDSR